MIHSIIMHVIRQADLSGWNCLMHHTVQHNMFQYWPDMQSIIKQEWTEEREYIIAKCYSIGKYVTNSPIMVNTTSIQGRGNINS